MKIRNIFNVLMVSALALMTFACTEKAPEYEPAKPVEGEGVYFSSTLPSKYTLDDSGEFSFEINRSATENVVTIPLEVTADKIFTVPTAAAFEAGKESAVIKIKYKPEDLELDKKYTIKVSVKEQLTPYGASDYEFVAVFPNPVVWEKVETESVFVENIFDAAFGVPESIYDVYVEKLQGKEIYRIANMFSTFTKDGKTYTHPEYGEGKSIWLEEIVDKENVVWAIIDADGEYLKKVDPSYSLAENEVFIPFQTTNVEWEYGEMSFGSAPYNLSSDGSTILPGDKFKLGRYDKEKGILTFGSLGFKLPTKGIYLNRAESKLYLDKKQMIEDYNKYQWTLPVYSGVLASQAFEGEFEQTVKVNLKDPSLYYLPDYFGEGYGLAFYSDTVSILKDGSEIKDVKNFQKTGLTVFGREIICNVKKGKVTIAEGKLPVFTIKIHLYSEAVEEQPELDFGEFEEVFTADTPYESYSISDFKKATKKDLTGQYDCTGADIFDPTLSGRRVPLSIDIAFAGMDTTVTENGDILIQEVYSLRGLSPNGQSMGWDDEVYGVLNKGGVLELQPACPNLLSDQYQVLLTTHNTNDFGALYLGSIFAGILNNGKFAVIPDEDFDTYAFFIKGMGALDMFGSVYGTKVSGEAAAATYVPMKAPETSTVYRNIKPLNRTENRSVKEKVLNTSKLNQRHVDTKTISEDAQILKVK